MDLMPLLSEVVLARVERPSRYLGAELNSVHKDLGEVDLRVCLAFPDSYDLGLGNLGIQILYHILNQRPGVWAERVCAPHPDLEAQLRQRGLPLFALESKHPLSAFDLLGFTLQWELNYTNILNMLDLGGIPVWASERTDEHPIIAAGGPCVFNPEPLAWFIDVFAVGDGEEVVVELAEAVREGGGREAILDRLASVPGCYVPARYPLVTSPTGVLVKPDEAPVITKRLVRNLDEQPFPTDYLVPFTPQVHDRVGLEVLRGCTQGCRFCQAGMVTRPVRERSLENLAQLQVETMRKTGYEDIGLVSLSTCDYSRVKNLVRQSVELAKPERIGVSLPSLRLDSFSVDLAHQISSVRKTGLTFAPEAATDRMRAVINKFITTDDLLDMTRQCASHGWELLKLYFMIGLPTETDEDVLAIGKLAHEAWEVGRSLQKRFRVNLSVSTFVPKPQTPFQWSAQISPEEALRRQKLVHSQLGPKSIKFGRQDAFGTYLEGLLTRGDRTTGWLLYDAWQNGARFDGWHEYLQREAWEQAFGQWRERTGRDARDELRERDLDEPLPWDHLDVMIPKGWLRQDYERATNGDWAKDCRQTKCHQCGVIDHETQACTTMLKQARVGAREETGLDVSDPPTWTEPPAVGRMRFRWARTGLVRLLSHHETLNVFVRALRRAQLPLRYSEGFHPHAELAFGSALPVGMETTGDYADITLTAELTGEEFIERLNLTLPEGFEILEAWPIATGGQALMALLETIEYAARIPQRLVPDGLPELLSAYLAQSEIIVRRRGKQRGQHVYRPVDIRPMIAALELTEQTPDGVTLKLRLGTHEGRPGKVEEVVKTLLGLMDEDLCAVIVCKTASYQLAGEQWREPAPEAVEQMV